MAWMEMFLEVQLFEDIACGTPARRYKGKHPRTEAGTGAGARVIGSGVF